MQERSEVASNASKEDAGLPASGLWRPRLETPAGMPSEAAQMQERSEVASNSSKEDAGLPASGFGMPSNQEIAIAIGAGSAAGDVPCSFVCGDALDSTFEIGARAVERRSQQEFVPSLVSDEDTPSMDESSEEEYVDFVRRAALSTTSSLRAGKG